jgi:hypothetical protein
MRSADVKDEDRLNGVDNFATWDRLIQAALGEDGRVEVGRDSTRFDETGKESAKLCRSCDALELD